MSNHPNENLQLIWLDHALRVNMSQDMYRCYEILQDVINPVHTFNDPREAFDFISRRPEEHFCLLVTGALGEEFVPKVHRLSQIGPIFIFCDNVNYHRTWAGKWTKIRLVDREIEPIRKQLNELVQRLAHHAVGFSMISSIAFNQESEEENFDPSFIYTNILKEIMLAISFDNRHQAQFLQFAKDKYRKNPQELSKLKDFEVNYNNNDPIHWYTRNGLLYPMVNQALRSMDILTLAHMGFFIHSLHKQIQSLHKTQYLERNLPRPSYVYRGQGISTKDFEALKRNVNGLIWFNEFLSTSLQESVAISFAQNALGRPDTVSVVYQMKIDPSMNSVPFALIRDKSFFRDEDEILFSMHTKFRVEKIEEMLTHAELWRVHLRLTEQIDEKMRQSLDYLRRELAPSSDGWLRFVFFLMKFKEFKQAEAICKMVLEQKPSDTKREFIFHNLGLIHMAMDDNDEALRYINEAVNIEKRIGSKGSAELSTLYTNRAVIYHRKGDLDKALSEHKSILQHRRASLPADDMHIAASYHSIGSVYYDFSKYSTALDYFLRELEIYKKRSSDFTPDLLANYEKLTLVNTKLQDYIEAEKYAELALKIRERIFPNDRMALATDLETLGSISEKLEKWDRAEQLYENALKYLPNQHKNRVKICKSLGAMARHKRNYPQAISYYKEAMKIEQAAVGRYHSNLYDIYKELSSLLKKIGNQDEAKTYAERAAKVLSGHTNSRRSEK